MLLNEQNENKLPLIERVLAKLFITSHLFDLEKGIDTVRCT